VRIAEEDRDGHPTARVPIAVPLTAAGQRSLTVASIVLGPPDASGNQDVLLLSDAGELYRALLSRNRLTNLTALSWEGGSIVAIAGTSEGFYVAFRSSTPPQGHGDYGIARLSREALTHP
jgi:hypothetical protein